MIIGLLHDKSSTTQVPAETKYIIKKFEITINEKGTLKPSIIRPDGSVIVDDTYSIEGKIFFSSFSPASDSDTEIISMSATTISGNTVPGDHLVEIHNASGYYISYMFSGEFKIISRKIKIIFKYKNPNYEEA